MDSVSRWQVLCRPFVMTGHRNVHDTFGDSWGIVFGMIGVFEFFSTRHRLSPANQVYWPQAGLCVVIGVCVSVFDFRPRVDVVDSAMSRGVGAAINVFLPTHVIHLLAQLSRGTESSTSSADPRYHPRGVQSHGGKHHHQLPRLQYGGVPICVIAKSQFF